MSSILFSLPELFASYKNWVSCHPQLASDFETTAKWISYFIAGRINNSSIVSELVYSLSNLLVLFNDRIICKAQKFEGPGTGDKIKLWLTVLDYSEVFFEISAKKLWGETGKWIIVVVLQIFKCISRLLLLFQHKENMIENPPIPVLKRKKIVQQYTTDYTVDEARNQLESMSFVLKRSGKVIRKVEAAPPVNLRNWKPLTAENNNDLRDQTQNSKIITGRQLVAETLYVLKPIAHLGSILCFGNNTWKPWMLSLIIDLASLHLHHSCQRAKMNGLTRKEKLELSRRHLSLALYLLRSPFYERNSRDRIQAFLSALSRKIPLAAMICSPLAQYIPHWQRKYFYMWST